MSNKLEQLKIELAVKENEIQFKKDNDIEIEDKLNLAVAVIKDKIEAIVEKEQKALLKEQEKEQKALLKEQEKEQKALLKEQEKEQEKEQKALLKIQIEAKKAEARAIQDELVIAEIHEILENRDIYYIQGQDTYMEYSPMGKWESYAPKSFRERYFTLLSKHENNLIFHDILEQSGMKKKNVVYSFNDVNEEFTLNLARRDKWLLPIQPETEEDMEMLSWIEVLISAIGGEKEENIQHILNVMAWKYFHPGDCTIPCLCIYGQGGVGKNLFVECMLGTIYGGGNVSRITYSDINGSYNGVCAGKTVVFLDENNHEKVSAEKLKSIVGSKFLTINEKYVKSYEVENTALYIIGANSPEQGPIRLGKDGSDRRWSIISVATELDILIARKLSQITGMECTVEEGNEYLRNELVNSVFRNPRALSLWLGQLKNRNVQKCPMALHGEDYKVLLEIQTGDDEDLFTEVFNHPEFTHIQSQTLYEIYKNRMAINNPRGGLLKINTLNVRAKIWLYKNKRNIEFIQRSGIRIGNGVKTSKAVFTITPGKIHEDNSNYYFTGEYMKEKYVEDTEATTLNKKGYIGHLKLAN